ncbi:MAG: N-acetyltransferase family protein [Phycisphaerae bacterium]
MIVDWRFAIDDWTAREAMNSISLRRAAKRDVGGIVEIEETCFDSVHERFNRRQIRRLVANPRVIVLVAVEKRGGRIAGWGAGLTRLNRQLSIANRKSVTGRVYALGVLPASQGRGVGRLLMERIIAELRNRGAGRIFLEVRADNAPAIALYRKLGFTELGTVKDYYSKGRHAMKMVIAPAGSRVGG